MFILNGIGLNNGLCLGKAHLIKIDDFNVEFNSIDKKKIKSEIDRFYKAIDKTINYIDTSIDSIESKFQKNELIALIAFNKLILKDPLIYEETPKIIKNHECNAEWALNNNLKLMIKNFEKIKDPYFRDRKKDVIDIVNKVMEVLLTAKKKIPNVTNKIIVTNNLSPYELLDLKKQNPKGLISATGSISSHIAIVAKNLNLPSIVGVKNATSLIRENDDVIIDSTLDSILINTDKNIKSFYVKKIKTFYSDIKKLEKIKRKKTLTLDKKRIYLRGTIDSPSEINKILNLNPDGIGLFRTEFLYEDANFSNTEKNHYKSYLSIAKKFKNKKVTFRTFDMGFDKNLNTKVDSPMGLRAVRYSLKNKDFFEIQMKSLLLVSLKFNINILVPFITSVQEVIEVRKIIKKVQNEISKKEKLRFKFKLGVMIEIPSTLFILEELSKLVDFFSIGTNDLIQFTLAADRNNADLNELSNPSHPAILKILQYLSLQSKKLNIPMSICGEVTNNIDFLKLLISYGFDDFSVSYSNFLSIKNSVLNLNFKALVAEYKKSNRYKINLFN